MMVVSIITDVRIYKVGSSYYAGSAFYRILERYAKGFGRVVLITRIIKSKKIPKDYSAVDNYCSEFINTQSIVHTALSVSQDIKDKIRDCDLVVLRLPSLISMFLFKYVKNYNKST